MAVPKRKTSRARRDKRRANWKVKLPSIVTCPQCGEAKLSHRACRHCGYYKRRQVIEV
ncbi:large subunit ribosomal protein L32 [Caldicoprobacter guelmensis]|uniref:50S ribosomal protein L32 n=1 Tax=Caldicoprobacter guelmensis TaxID=1170224 RepID=UPI00195A8CC1|nr:50S ribosomal protein L32 [Caldicoprobacter guelmensis]MBM7581219.1 large subunit ribosomal protein L32 [Caldicoprobacter guelmensis]